MRTLRQKQKYIRKYKNLHCLHVSQRFEKIEKGHRAPPNLIKEISKNGQNGRFSELRKNSNIPETKLYFKFTTSHPVQLDYFCGREGIFVNKTIVHNTLRIQIRKIFLVIYDL